MNLSESTRIIKGLWSMGLPDEEITRFIVWVETGDEAYLPRPRKDEKED